MIYQNQIVKNCKIQDLICQCNHAIGKVADVELILKEINSETQKQSAIITKQISDLESQRELDAAFCDYIRKMKYDSYM